MGARPFAHHPSQATQGQRESARQGSSEMAQCLLRRTWVNLLSLNPSQSGQCSSRDPLTGEPDARKPPVRFGGRGGALDPVPTPIKQRSLRNKTSIQLEPGSMGSELRGLKRSLAYT